VIAPALTPQLTKWLNDGQIVHHPREFLAADLEDVVLALAATNDRDVNHQIAEIAASHNIPVSVADCKEECTFFFPAIAAADGFVAGLVSNGDDHKGVAQLAARVRTVLHDFRSGS
jgi:precorrin-2 dehydrogenase/sirohydrochlorin ferrochelatase/precorrin-6A/cobalt-precorrin-6A reductase